MVSIYILHTSIRINDFGFSSIPQLSTSLAVAFTALELGLIDSSLQVSIVLLSITTVLVAPFVVGLLAKTT